MFLAVLCLHCCGEQGLSQAVASGGYSLVVVCGLLNALASRCRALVPGMQAIAVVTHGLSCPQQAGSSLIRDGTRVPFPGRRIFKLDH